MADTSERKTIQINPELFKVSGNTTRKNRKPKQTNNPIKVKDPKVSTPKNNSTLKKNLLKLIRNHQQQQPQQPQQPQQQPSKEKSSSITYSSHETNIPKSEFEQSLHFLSKINESTQSHDKKEKKLKKVKNQTIRNVIPIHSVKPMQTGPMSLHSTSTSTFPPSTHPNMIASMPPTIHLDQMPLPSENIPPMVLSQPKPWGCLKNGSLPTYRMWKNQTQKQLPSGTLPKPPKPLIEISPSENMKQYESELNQKIQEISKMEQLQQKKTEIPCILKKPRKQRRILRRTFRVGKSKTYPRVSVLVSNKTIRNKTNLKSIGLQQTPIKDVKQYLLKQGFIKVGTTTPNNVLRQMYESAQMLPGEVKNYNPENLLFNYFNSTEEDTL